MSRRECPQCGVEALMSGPGIIKTYSGTPSWSDIKQPFERFQNDPYSDLFCTNCYHTQ